MPEQILVTRCSEDFGPAIGEYCIARALAVTQKMRELEAAQRRREWAGTTDPVRIAGTRAVIVGTGMVGRGIARCFVAWAAWYDGLSRSGLPAEPFHRSVRLGEFGPTVKGAQWLILALPRTRGHDSPDQPGSVGRMRRRLSHQHRARCGGRGIGAARRVRQGLDFRRGARRLRRRNRCRQIHRSGPIRR